MTWWKDGMLTLDVPEAVEAIMTTDLGQKLNGVEAVKELRSHIRSASQCTGWPTALLHASM